VWTAVLLAPPLILWCVGADNAAHHRSPTDWQYNHRVKRQLADGLLLILGVPAAGALLGAILGEFRLSADPARTTAGGTLLGVVGVWVYGAYSFYEALTHLTFVF
jgi:hypothetical protein